MSKKSIEVLVGLFVLLGLAAMVFLALQAGNLAAASTEHRTYTLQARFDNIGGLKVRAPVRSAGVNVGRVSRIALDPKTYLGVVTMEVQDKFQFPRDSSAKILTAGLLGDQYVGIEAGGDEQNLEPNAVITRTQSAIVLENLIGQVLFNRAADAGSSEGGAPGAAPAASGAKP